VTLRCKLRCKKTYELVKLISSLFALLALTDGTTGELLFLVRSLFRYTLLKWNVDTK
jgi:hypothetical protein